MKLYTFGELDDKVRLDLDMQDTDFLPYDELAGYCNEAIDAAEAEVLKISEDYFLKPAATNLSLVTGETDILLPTDIYAEKIRGITYHNGVRIYPLVRLRGLPNKFTGSAFINQYPGALPEYNYFLIFPTAGEQAKIRIFPPAQESGAFLELWYLRNANRVPLTTEAGQSRTTQRAAVVDLPECQNYVMQYMKARMLEKALDPRLEAAIVVLGQYKSSMIDTLTQQIPDDQDTVEMDFSSYEEMS